MDFVPDGREFEPLRLYVSLPKTHFLARKTDGVTFQELDGQSFLIARELGLWDDVIEKRLARSKFFRQDTDSLAEIVNASVIPCFATNVTFRYRGETTRVFIPILDEDAKKTFYALYKTKKRDVFQRIKDIG